MRATLELAAASDPPLKGEQIAAAQQIPLKFLENILIDLRHAGLVISQCGPEGGYRLDRPADAITVADVIRAVDGPLAAVRGDPRPPGDDGSSTPGRWRAHRRQCRRSLARGARNEDP